MACKSWRETFSGSRQAFLKSRRSEGHLLPQQQHQGKQVLMALTRAAFPCFHRWEMKAQLSPKQPGNNSTDTQQQRAEGSATGSPGPGGWPLHHVQMCKARTLMKISFHIIRKCFASPCPAQNNHVKNICNQRTIKDHMATARTKEGRNEMHDCNSRAITSHSGSFRNQY